MSLFARSPRALTYFMPYVLSVGAYVIHLHVRALSGALSFESLIEMCWFFDLLRVPWRRACQS